MSHTPEPWSSEGIFIVGNIEKYFPRWNCREVAEVCGQGERNPYNSARIVACVNGCAGLNPEAYRECVEALASVLKFSHLYLTSSEEARQRPLFGRSLHGALSQSIQEARTALLHTQETR